MIPFIVALICGCFTAVCLGLIYWLECVMGPALGSGRADTCEPCKALRSAGLIVLAASAWGFAVSIILTHFP